MAECRRSVLSCARCRRRKIKCDRGIPCGQCTAAKADCTGYSSKDQDASIPRSIVQHLEAELAKVEGELARNGHLDELNASDTLAGMAAQNGIPFTDQVVSPLISAGPSPFQSNPASSPFQTPKQELKEMKHEILTVPNELPVHAIDEEDPIRREIMKCKELQATIYSILTPGPGMTKLIASVRMSLTPSTALKATSPRDPKRKSSLTLRPANQDVSCVMLRRVPVHIIKSLMKKYMHKVYPVFPVMHSPTVWIQLENVLKTLQALPPQQRTLPPSYDFLIIYLCLAVSATLGSAKTGREQKHMSFSASLFEEGIGHFSERAKIPSDLAGIQISLLVLQYAAINPRQANVWMLSGSVMRACLELGLHREPPDPAAFDVLTLDLRRRVFWSGYCFDRSICSALQRPLSCPDETVNALCPSTFDDRYIRPTGIDTTGVETKAHITRWVQFRRLQSNMVEVHFQNKPLPPGLSWEDWLSDISRQLHAWYAAYKDGRDLTDFTFWHGLVNLHRPSPRREMPAPESLLMAFEAACASAVSLREHLLSGFYRRSWLSAHHNLENSMVVLFCLRHGYEIIGGKFESQKIFEMTKVFTANFLTLASQGWDEVSNYAGIYERLLGPLLESVFSKKTPSLSSFGPAQDAELLRLLYPGPAQLDKLRFGTRGYGSVGSASAMSGFTDIGLPSLDMVDINWDDFSVSETSPAGEKGPGSAGPDTDWDFPIADLDMAPLEMFAM